MLPAVISMELHLTEPSDRTLDLMAVGATYARDTQSLCSDLAAAIFPSAVSPLTESTTSAVTGKLVTLIWDIESRLRGATDTVRSGLPTTWEMLARSGFLRERRLIDFFLARVAEDRLEASISSASQELPARLLDHADPNIAEAAQVLLAANSLHRSARGITYQALYPELLHQLCWRLVAAIEVTDGARDPSTIHNARNLLAAYDEAATAQSAAGKIVHFLANQRATELADQEIAGLQLYVGYLAHRLELDHDHILHLMDSYSAAPFALLLRAVDTNAENALGRIYRFRSHSLTPRDVALFERGYDRIEPDLAKAEVRSWAMARAQYLIFSNGTQAGA